MPPEEHPGPRRAMALAAALLAAAACAGPGPSLEGPMAARNQHPAQLVVGTLPPRSVETTAVGEVDLRVGASYSSLFLGKTRGPDSLILDGEVLRGFAAVRTGLRPGVDVEVEVPFLYGDGGFLDDSIIRFHDAFGFPQAGRDRTPKGRFDVRASRGGETAMEWREGRGGLGDVPLAVQWQLAPARRGGPPGLALRAGLDLPAGRSSRGHGSGRAEPMLGAAAEGHWWGAGFSAGLSHTFAATPARARRAGVPYRDVTVLHGGVEVPVGGPLALLAQTAWETSTLRALDLGRTVGPHWLLWVGGRVRLSRRVRLELALGEDLRPRVSPDFTARVALLATLP